MNGNYAVIGLFAGLLLAIAVVTGGLIGFLLAVVLAGAGGALGAHLDGTIDPPRSVAATGADDGDHYWDGAGAWGHARSRPGAPSFD